MTDIVRRGAYPIVAGQFIFMPGWRFEHPDNGTHIDFDGPGAGLIEFAEGTTPDTEKVCGYPLDVLRSLAAHPHWPPFASDGDE